MAGTSPTDDEHDEHGASATEYGLLISGIAALIVAAILLLGGAVQGLFSDTCETVNAQTSSRSACSTP